MHKTENCLRIADFYCVHGTHRSEFVHGEKLCVHMQYASLSTSLVLLYNQNGFWSVSEA